MSRHDPQRTGLSTQQADIPRPALRWRRYMGGSVQSLLAADAAPSDLGNEVLFVSGGRLVARRADDAPLWQTPLLGLRSIASQTDLNGDGADDLVVTGIPGFVGVFSPRDGSMLWHADGENFFGNSVGSLRVTDVNGDGQLDVYAADAACGSGGADRAFLFSFTRGFGGGTPDTTTQRWSLEQGRDYACGSHDVIADLDGDGRNEVVTFGSAFAYVYDGATGRKRSSGMGMPAYGGYPLGFTLPYGQIWTHVVDVDGDGRQDIVGLTNNGYAPEINSRAVFVLSWNPGRPTAERFYVRWRQSVRSVRDDQHLFTSQAVVDLDGDGRAEIVSAFATGSPTPTPTTYVYRASDGARLAELAGVAPEGVLSLGAGSTPLLLVTRGNVLEAYQFSRGGFAARPTMLFRADDARLVTWFDPRARRVDDGVAEPISWMNASGGLSFVTMNVDRTRLVRWDLTREGRATRGPQWDVSPGIVLAVVPQQRVWGPGNGLLVTRSDGVVASLDTELRPLNLGDETVALSGVRTGGFYSGEYGTGGVPIAVQRPGTGDMVLMTDSRGVLLAMDPVSASVVSPPTVRWETEGASFPTVFSTPSGPAVVSARRENPTAPLRGVAAQRLDTGAPLWSWSLARRPSESVLTDIVPLRNRMGQVDRLSFGTADRSDANGRIYVLRSDGSSFSESAPIMTLGSGQGQPSALDLNDDGDEDVLASMSSSLRIFDGRSSRLLGESSDSQVVSWTTIVLRGMSDAAVDAVTAASYHPVTAFSFSREGDRVTVTPRYRSAVTDPSMYITAAVARCEDGLRLAGSLGQSSDMYVLDLNTGAVRAQYTLSGGRAYRRGEGPDGARGVLGNVNASPALVRGRPGFVVGNTDGYLYALDACAQDAEPQLFWAMNFETPVGESIFADTNGDGSDELVVSTGDGYLQAIDAERFVAPTWVYDTDPEGGFPDTDVDQVYGNALHALWPEVPGAVGYEWALFTVRGTPITRNPSNPSDPFIPVSSSTHTARVDYGLVAGSRYIFSVRAVGPEGRRSAETVSDGVTWLPGWSTGLVPPTPVLGDAGSDGGVGDASADGDRGPYLNGRAGPLGSCACSTAPGALRSGSSLYAAWALSALFAASGLLRRRRNHGAGRRT